MKTGCFMAAFSLLALSSPWARADAEAPGTNQPAASTNRITRWGPVTSHQRNFIVTSMPKADALDLAVWAENVRAKLEEFLGARIPNRQMYPLIISAAQDSSVDRGWVEAFQQISSDSNFRQEMVLVNPAYLDQEDVLERMVRLLLDRWIFYRMRIVPGASVPAMPDWLGTGIAQQLYPELKARNIRELQERSGDAWRASDVFGWQTLPPGRWTEKYLAGAFVEWMGEKTKLIGLVDAYASRRAAGGILPESEWLAFVSCASARELNMAFDTWLARQRYQVIPGEFQRDTAAIDELLQLRSSDLGLIWSRDRDQRIPPEMLVQRRGEPWVRKAAVHARNKLSWLLINRPPEAVQAASFYLEFFDDLANPAGRLGADELLKRWQQGGEAMEAYTSNQQAIERILNEASLPAVAPGEPDQQALEDMLDRWESAPAMDEAIKP